MDLNKDACFGGALNYITPLSWLSLKSVIENSLSNPHSAEYEKIVDELLESFL